ncbi:hypothetical protein [Arsenophonus apicola]|jgi:hypothetical protein|uniref:hypothetical protein n=1 Tax=Arsenophonus apicola TaxID=2879119 RepID=UPI001CDCDDED|nr:hypothetical protein [Arsenophonus apicola]UBX28591.1 hypothetical protein LDL57_12415 [Arsenophonus apicola]
MNKLLKIFIIFFLNVGFVSICHAMASSTPIYVCQNIVIQKEDGKRHCYTFDTKGQLYDIILQDDN